MLSWHYLVLERGPGRSRNGEYYFPHLTDDKTKVKRLALGRTDRRAEVQTETGLTQKPTSFYRTMQSRAHHGIIYNRQDMEAT